MNEKKKKKKKIYIYIYITSVCPKCSKWDFPKSQIHTLDKLSSAFCTALFSTEF